MISFGFEFLSFLVLNLIVLFNSLIVTSKLYDYKIRSFLKFIITIFVVFVANVLLSQKLLGVFSVLNYLNLFLLNIVVFLALLFYFGKEFKDRFRLPDNDLKLDWKFLALLLSPFLFIYLLRFFTAIYQIPLEYDNVAYHLPFVVEWLKTGDLLSVYYSAFANAIGYYPSNFELFNLWLYLPFNADYFVNLVNLPFFPMLLLAFYAVARNMNISSRNSLYAGAFFLYMPQTFRQMGVPLVDVFFSLMFVLGIFYLQEYVKSKSKIDALLFGFTLGVFVGVKYLGLPYLFPFAFLILYFLIKQFNGKWLDFSKVCLIVFSGGFLGGGFWYLRNWIQSGNPLFPVEVKLGDFVLFDGIDGMTENVLSSSLLNQVDSLEKLKEFVVKFYYMVGGQSAILLLSFLVIFCLILYGLWLKFVKNKDTELLLPVTIFMSGVFYFFFYWKAPYTYQDLIPNVRYSMMFLATGSLMVAYCMDRSKLIGVVNSLLIPFVFVINFAYLILNVPSLIIPNDRLVLDWNLISILPWYFVMYLAIIMVLAFVAYILRYKFYRVACLLIVLLLFVSPFFLNKSFEKREFLASYYSKMWQLPANYQVVEVSEWLDENANDSSVAYAGFNFHYYLFGRQLQRDVDHVNVNECLECGYEDYKNIKGTIRSNPNYEDWLSNFQALNKEYLVVGTNVFSTVKMWEKEWADESDLFELVFDTDDYFVYKFLGEA